MQAQKRFRQRTIDSPSCVSNGCIGDLNKRIPKEYVQDGSYTTNPVSVLELGFEEPRSHVRKSSYESNKTSYTQRIHNCGKTDNTTDACVQTYTQMDANESVSLQTKTQDTGRC
ncbi:hypothetical protein CHS0354_016468 [Potamilus streckersoni]|uniref:Uncharacterized protein n=1 Tax=Potamilus streckersoni TaxID=2493646 RepID=A0AAE0TJK2_9BIVA|nr:hypothetical protein CHS0354_016468 [Potamilus streckersoni]